MIRSLARTSAVELRLFLREPVTAVFTLALPLVLLFVLGGVFGNDPNPRLYRGVGAMNYYVPAYVALVLAAMGVITLPAHLAAYHERGVLRRFRASSIPPWSVLGVTLVAATATWRLLRWD